MANIMAKKKTANLKKKAKIYDLVVIILKQQLGI
jgi:hypothetical protein